MMDSLGLRRNSRTGMVVPVMRLSITGLLKLGMCRVSNAAQPRWNDQSIHAAGCSKSKPDDKVASGLTADPGSITCFENFRWRSTSVMGILRQLRKVQTARTSVQVAFFLPQLIQSGHETL